VLLSDTYGWGCLQVVCLRLLSNKTIKTTPLQKILLAKDAYQSNSSGVNCNRSFSNMLLQIHPGNARLLLFSALEMFNSSPLHCSVRVCVTWHWQTMVLANCDGSESSELQHEAFKHEPVGDLVLTH
jgi:hypothetical protein